MQIAYHHITGESMNEVEVFVGNHTIIDPMVYGLWLKGYSGNTILGFLKHFYSEK